MKLFRRIFLAALGLCLSLGIAVAAAACGKTNGSEDPKPINYTVTVSCADSEVLESVQVQLYSGSTAATEKTGLDEEHKAVFSLKPATYSVKITGAEGYTYPETEVTKEKPTADITLTAILPDTYPVAYDFGNCDGIAYAGDSTIPDGFEKAAGETFPLEEAPVWEGYTFLGWHDGNNLLPLDADYKYEMPDHGVTFTAQWEETLPAGYVKDKNITVPTWAENATTGSYKIEKGQFVKITAAITKETGDSAYGIPGKIFPNSNVDNNNFYQFRCDFAIKRVNWSWNENNDGFTVDNGGWNRETYRTSTAGEVEIIVALSEDGVLTYTFKYTSTSSDYAHERVFTDNTKMDSALVIFGLDHATAKNAHVVYPKTVQITLDYGYDSKTETSSSMAGGTYTFKSNPNRTGYVFVGWRLNGTGNTYYVWKDTYPLGNEDVTFVAFWVEKLTITTDKDGGSGNLYTTNISTYNTETGMFDVTFPSFTDGTSNTALKKSGYAFKCFEVTVNGQLITVEGDTFTAAPGSTVAFKVIWGDLLTLSYSFGGYGDISYAGTPSKVPGTVNRAEGGKVLIETEPAWAGYTFLGWSDGESETLYQKGDNYTMPDHSVTLTAQWSQAPHYTIVFEGGDYEGVPFNGNNNIDTKDPMYEGGKFALARALVWEGYKFLGWKTDGDETVYKALAQYTMPAHDVVFKAVWEKLPTHSVTYVANAGSDTVYNMPASTTYYETQVLMIIPVRYGYTFLGWSDGENIYKAGDALSMTKDGITLTAQWEALSEENANLAKLSGIWEYEDEYGTVYFEISGLAAAWDAFKAIGSFKAGELEIKDQNDIGIEFLMTLPRPTTSATNKYSAVYYFELDEIHMVYGGVTVTFTRSASTPAPAANVNAQETRQATADVTLPDIYEEDKKRA